MSARLTSRRAALGALAAAATVPAGIGLANPGAGLPAAPDAALLAIAPSLLPLLEQADAMQPEISRLHKEATAERDKLNIRTNRHGAMSAFECAADRNGYNDKWEAWNSLLKDAGSLLEPFADYRPKTLEGLLLKGRYAAAMDDESLLMEDIAALLKQRYGVTVTW